MTVYLFERSHYTEVELLEVYASDTAAMRAHPAPAGAEWAHCGSPGYWRVKGLRGGDHQTIEPHEVKGE